ncbi:hypothetical protein E8E13_000536 [Curvularia kusanoi]|uniref:Poly(A) RNA polymerase mitochondrial-like central palm domain-containing protein n=1 Tax=Curvularia kusanoi TaxID=90978 RepID=A0A9P4T3N2_CURKU|nr:hypothetical protein E8E13_000536 [Curvularia kusanoi]
MVKSGRDRLNLEIQRFHDFILPTKAETVARKHLIEQVRQHVQSTLPDYVLEVFGSQRTGLAFAASDIDLRLLPAHVTSDTTLAKLPPSLEERDRRKSDLRKLLKAVGRNYRSDYLLPTLRWARYPLLSLQDRASGLDIQVVLSNDTSVSREYMQRYTQDYPYLPRVYSVLKASLDIRGLSDVFRGGIGSYSLFMMIVASLKHKPHPGDDAAGALENFLKFWAYFKTETYGVSIEPPELFNRSEQAIMHEKVLEGVLDGKSAPLPQWMLTIRDPADETNDLGRKAVAWKHIQATWKSLLTSLMRATEQNTCISLLGGLVGPIYIQQQAHRKILAAYGSSLAEAGKRLNTTSQGSPVDVDASLTVPKASEVNELAAIAQAVRNGTVMPTHSSCEAEGDEGKGRVHRWLTEDAEVPQHKDTREAVSSMLGLDKQVTTAKREE